MAKDKEDIFSTNIRMPKHLAHKLSILADSDDRSLNSYMAMALEEYVTEFEKDMSLAYEGDFDKVYKSVFGEDIPPYITISVTETDIGKAKTIIKNIPRGAQRTTSTARDIFYKAAKEQQSKYNSNDKPLT